MSTIKKAGSGPQPPPTTPTTHEGAPAQVAEQNKAAATKLLDRTAAPPDEAVQKWFLTKGQNTASIQGQIRKGLENLLQSYYSVKGQGAMALQAQEMLARSGQVVPLGLDSTGRKKRLARWLQKKAKSIAAEFNLTEEEASEFVAMLALSFGAKSNIVYPE